MPGVRARLDQESLCHVATAKLGHIEKVETPPQPVPLTSESMGEAEFVDSKLVMKHLVNFRRTAVFTRTKP